MCKGIYSQNPLDRSEFSDLLYINMLLIGHYMDFELENWQNKVC